MTSHRQKDIADGDICNQTRKTMKSWNKENKVIFLKDKIKFYIKYKHPSFNICLYSPTWVDF